MGKTQDLDWHEFKNWLTSYPFMLNLNVLQFLELHINQYVDVIEIG